MPRGLIICLLVPEPALASETFCYVPFDHLVKLQLPFINLPLGIALPISSVHAVAANRLAEADWLIKRKPICFN